MKRILFSLLLIFLALGIDAQNAWVTAASGLRLRETASLSAKVVVLIPFGQKVQVLERTKVITEAEGIEGTLVKLSWNGKTGYAFDGFLSEIEPKDIFKVTEACAIFKTMDATELARFDKMGEDEKAEVGSDMGYYAMTANDYLKSKKIKTITTEKRFLRFEGPEGKFYFFDCYKIDCLWQVILFKPGKAPLVMSTVDFSAGQEGKATTYFK